MQGHINLPPEPGSNRSIDCWHVDSTPFVLIVLTSQAPPEGAGGRFQYLHCGAEAARKVLRSGSQEAIDALTVSPAGLEQGHAILAQGSQIMHRASHVDPMYQRVTFVQSYVPRTTLGIHNPAPTLSGLYNSVDPLHVLLPDWSRNQLWRALQIVKESFNTWNGTWDSLSLIQMPQVAALLAFLRRLIATLETALVRIPYTEQREVLVTIMLSCLEELPEIKTMLEPDAIRRTFKQQQDAFVAEYPGYSGWNPVDVVEEVEREIKAGVEGVLSLSDSTMEYFM